MQIALIGGTGFVGSYLADALLAGGHSIRMLVRPGSESKVQHPDGVQTVAGDLASEQSLQRLMQGCDAVIYNVGILRETPKQNITFESIQYDGVVSTVHAALAARVSRFLLMSANGAKAMGTAYQETKFRAEQYAFQSGLDVTVFRPSVIFGDPRGRMEFATQLYQDMVRPPIPAINFFTGSGLAAGSVVMSPVHAQDVADAFVAALAKAKAIGKTYVLGGPEVLTWKEMIARIAAATGREKWIIPMPIALMRLAAAMLDWLPVFPVTRDQLTMLAEGNAVDPTVLSGLIVRPPRNFSIESLQYLRK